MTYRYAAIGTLEVPAAHLDKVCTILTSKSIHFEREGGTTIRIEHEERTSLPGAHQPTETFAELAPYIERPQAICVTSDLLGERQVGFVHGAVCTDSSEKVWSTDGEAPTPDVLLDALRDRGIAAKVQKLAGKRKSGRRPRVFEILPNSGGAGCRITIKKRFLDGFDLLAVPEVYESLCRKYHVTPDKLREELHSAKFGVEVRSPALGGPSTAMIYDNLLEILEEHTDGIRTELG